MFHAESDRVLTSEERAGLKEWHTTFVVLSLIQEYPSEEAQETAAKEMFKCDSSVIREVTVDTDASETEPAYTLVDMRLLAKDYDDALHATVAETLGGLATAGLDITYFSFVNAHLVENKYSGWGVTPVMPAELDGEDICDFARQTLSDYIDGYEDLQRMASAA